MINKIKTLLAGLLMAPMLALGIVALAPVATTVGATCDISNPSIASGAQCAEGTNVAPTLFGNGGIFNTIVNIMLFLIGAIAVIMLIIGGIRYTVSGGAQAEVTNAKNTILYAIIGLVVAFLAYAIVNWVLGGIGASGSSS